MTLGDVPERAWDELALPGVDTVWLMGVWERSPAGREIARTDGSVRAATAAALPGATSDDVVGSPYCIRSYTVDAQLGGRAGLAAARAALARRGLRLLLDFVPNHVAPDHDWVAAHPEYFVHGTEADLEREPAAWRRTDGGVVACGRDPYFPAWTDVLQLDPMSPGLRDAVVATVEDIAAQCDGVRCDMAMLMLDDVAASTWGERLQPRRPEPYWVEITRRVRASQPQFRFLAEAYWDLEGVLLEQGIDACYDKRLYDRLVEGDVDGVRAHLAADPAWQARLVRFLENHDEPRAAAAFPPDRLRAAAVALLTLPGVPLLYEGQLDGARVRLPVQLGRFPDEPVDEESRAFWLHALRALDGVRAGDWRLFDVHGWPDNDSCRHLLAWRWDDHLVVINYSDTHADGLVALNERAGELVDVLHDRSYGYEGGDLYVALAPYDAHVLRLH